MLVYKWEIDNIYTAMVHYLIHLKYKWRTV